MAESRRYTTSRTRAFNSSLNRRVFSALSSSTHSCGVIHVLESEGGLTVDIMTLSESGVDLLMVSSMSSAAPPFPFPFFPFFPFLGKKSDLRKNTTSCRKNSRPSTSAIRVNVVETSDDEKLRKTMVNTIRKNRSCDRVSDPNSAAFTTASETAPEPTQYPRSLARFSRSDDDIDDSIRNRSHMAYRNAVRCGRDDVSSLVARCR